MDGENFQCSFWWRSCSSLSHIVSFLFLMQSRFTEYFFIDCVTLSTRIVAKILGPLITIFCIQSKGWPFVVAGWGVWDMLLLHGNNDFQQHWLYWSGLAIYSKANSGSYIIESQVYLRILLAMVIAGLATAIKRTAVTIYFGKRNFGTSSFFMWGVLVTVCSFSTCLVIQNLQRITSLNWS